MPPKKPGPTSQRPPSASAGTKRTSKHVVDLPAGGQLELKTPEEVAVWNETRDRYLDDYALTKTNDLILLGAILSQALIMFRAQNDLANPKATIVNSAQGRIQKAAEEIRDLEKALGVDKKTREAGGQHTVADYITRLKRAAHAKGVRISERTLEYERFNMELRWRIRLLRNGDEEDRRHHGITLESIIAFCEQNLADIEEKDKEWAREKYALVVGTL